MDVGFGTLLKRGDGGSPETFVAVAEVVSIDCPLSRDEIDGTHHQSTNGWREFKPGLKSMEISFEGNYLPDDPTHNAAAGLIKDFADPDLHNYRIEWPVAGVKWTASAFLREFDPAAPVEDKLGMSGTLRVSGEPTLE
jgi:predicted secreted protein